MKREYTPSQIPFAGPSTGKVAKSILRLNSKKIFFGPNGIVLVCGDCNTGSIDFLPFVLPPLRTNRPRPTICYHPAFALLKPGNLGCNFYP